MCEVTTAVGKYYDENNPENGLLQFEDELKSAEQEGEEAVFDMLSTVSNSVKDMLRSIENSWIHDWTIGDVENIPKEERKMLEELVPKTVDGGSSRELKIVEIVLNKAMAIVAPESRNSLEGMKKDLVFA